ncbi:AIPR family protein [Nostoc sp. JL23]|uniref:AIPR family protein n=1 Tax=Nostoc sp. JL23 TaxID=2815394 RepID=UPI001D5F80DB|nr:AIPR family protein [Nostoc sp. JL23]MBN3876934.1 AIPR family protein [Nostoc sp. JL23]
MVRLQLTHIKNKLNETLTGLIDISDHLNKAESEKQKVLLSRSYAAYSLMSLASLEPEIAAQAIVDGYGDNGIDAIYYDESEKIFWIVQSKWIESGNGEPDTGEIHKFIQGIKDIIDFKFEKFNLKVNNKQILIEKALADYSVKVKIILAYSGTKLGDHNRQIISNLLEENNEASELFFWETFSLYEAHKALSASLEGKPVNADLNLTSWGQIEEPYQAIYGQIDAQTLAEIWLANGESLFSKNIRSFVGLSDVNDGIQDTLLSAPHNFLYLNNGVTVLCHKIHKKPMGGSDKSIGYFHCEGISIVNGAQTVGTIGNTYKKDAEKVNQAKVFIKLISLENCPPDFSLRVTKATNTQNKVENRDFISLDSLQEKLKIDFALAGINYSYKRNDKKSPVDSKNCSFEEAIIALACSLNEIRYTLMAKDKIGKLWEDVNKPPYTELFHENITAITIWRKIQIMRVLDTKLTQKQNSNVDKEKGTCIYGNRFILHMIFTYVGKSKLFISDSDFEKYLENELPELIDNVITKTLEGLNSKYPQKLVYQFFRNLENYKSLKNLILEYLPVQ